MAPGLRLTTWPSQSIRMAVPATVKRRRCLSGLCHREAELVKEGPHHAQPTATMQPMSIGEYDSPHRDGLQREPIKEQQVRMGDHRGLCILTILGPDEAWALFQQHAMVRATTHPG